MNAFRFKQFTIEQEHCAFKVGTDSILLGAWVKPPATGNILDVGTGSGILALMMAQKSEGSMITAIDIDAGAALQARANAEASPWKERVVVHHQPMQECDGTFDLIITNPPYFNTDTVTADARLAQARNTLRISFQELVEHAFRLLNHDGQFCLVLPTKEAQELCQIAEGNGFGLLERCRVFTRPGEHYEKRHLMLFQKGKQPVTTVETALIIEEGERHHYSEAFRNLTRDFYLGFKNESPKIPME